MDFVRRRHSHGVKGERPMMCVTCAVCCHVVLKTVLFRPTESAPRPGTLVLLAAVTGARDSRERVGLPGPDGVP